MVKNKFIKFFALFLLSLLTFSCGTINRLNDSNNNISIEQKIKRYIKLYAPIARKQMKVYKIPASVTMAQGILESGYGEATLAKKGNNHFGIKCHKDWKGKKIFHDDDEENECFRSYSNPVKSYKDHSLFLANRDRYRFLFDLNSKDYKSWAEGLKKAGYATDPEYSKKLISLIERFNLSPVSYTHLRAHETS